VRTAKHTQQAEVLKSLHRASHEGKRQADGVSEAVQSETANSFPTTLQEGCESAKALSRLLPVSLVQLDVTHVSRSSWPEATAIERLKPQLGNVR
jgi:hypothetical protein